MQTYMDIYREPTRIKATLNLKAHLYPGDVDGFVEENPGDGLVTGGLCERALVGQVVVGVWQQGAHRQRRHLLRLTCTTQGQRGGKVWRLLRVYGNM